MAPELPRHQGRIRQSGGQRPWANVRPETAAVLREALPVCIARVVDAVQQEVPPYRVRDGSSVHKALLAGVSVALTRLVDLLGTQTDALGDAASLYERIGSGEYRSGRPLEDVLSAYRVGATTTWQTFSSAALDAGATSSDIAALAEACFAYINEIAATSTQGYARAQAADAGAQQQAMSELITHVIRSDVSSPRAAALLRRISWTPPEAILVIVLPLELAAQPLSDLRALPGALAAATDHGTLALLPGQLPDFEARRLNELLRDVSASAGTVQRVEDAAVSWRHAELLQQYRSSWGLPERGLLRADEHLAPLLVHADASLVTRLQERMLGPFLALSPERRAPLLSTLRYWLLYAGARGRVAERLTLHPQTVSYRMERIRELIGPQLDDPQARWATQLALMTLPDSEESGSANQ